MVRDPKIYPNPNVFNQERFLEEVDEQTAKARDVRNYVFGFGRRRCPGLFMIDSSLWIAVASMIASFDIRKAVDEFGNTVEPEVIYDNSVFTCVSSCLVLCLVNGPEADPESFPLVPPEPPNPSSTTSGHDQHKLSP